MYDSDTACVFVTIVLRLHYVGAVVKLQLFPNELPLSDQQCW